MKPEDAPVRRWLKLARSIMRDRTATLDKKTFQKE
jgi:hypothetical protein